MSDIRIEFKIRPLSDKVKGFFRSFFVFPFCLISSGFFIDSASPFPLPAQWPRREDIRLGLAAQRVRNKTACVPEDGVGLFGLFLCQKKNRVKLLC